MSKRPFLKNPEKVYRRLLSLIQGKIRRNRIRLLSQCLLCSSPYKPSSIPKIENKPHWNSPPIANFDVPLNNYINAYRTKQMQYFHPSRSYFHDLDQLLLSTLNRQDFYQRLLLLREYSHIVDLKCSIATDLNRGNNSYSDENIAFVLFDMH